MNVAQSNLPVTTRVSTAAQLHRSLMVMVSCTCRYTVGVFIPGGVQEYQ